MANPGPGGGFKAGPISDRKQGAMRRRRKQGTFPGRPGQFPGRGPGAVKNPNYGGGVPPTTRDLDSRLDPREWMGFSGGNKPRVPAGEIEPGFPGKDIKNLNYGGDVPPNLNFYGGDVPPSGGGGAPPQPQSMNTGAYNQAPGSNAKWRRLQEQWRAGDNRQKIRQMMIKSTNYNDGTPADPEIAAWLRRQQMNPRQQDQQRIRVLTQGLGGQMADPMSTYNLQGRQFGERGQGLVDELGGLLQKYPNYNFKWSNFGNSSGPELPGRTWSRAEMNEYFNVGSPRSIWKNLFPQTQPPGLDSIEPWQQGGFGGSIPFTPFTDGGGGGVMRQPFGLSALNDSYYNQNSMMPRRRF